MSATRKGETHMLPDYVHDALELKRTVADPIGPKVVLISYQNRKTGEAGDIRLDAVESFHWDDSGAIVIMRSGVTHRFLAPPNDYAWWESAVDVLSFK